MRPSITGALRRLGLPTLVLVNKIDRVGARQEDLLDDIRRLLTPHAIPLSRVTDIGTPAARVLSRPLDDLAAGTLAEVDTGVLAALAYGPPPTQDELWTALTARTGDGSVHPVCFGSAIGGQGVAAPAEGPTRPVPRPLSPADAAPRGTVFAVRTAPGSERTAHLRLYEGEMTYRQQRFLVRREAGRGTQDPRVPAPPGSPPVNASRVRTRHWFRPLRGSSLGTPATMPAIGPA
ncbi:hypothetical protein [Streptomyces rhizosphaerihabitans]|uniref:hypothetical protein n=1 Tax=Streptomyces rhizosphaerihabitans TaxID=1266770 RepID=UPI0021BE8651|nr:hypothetical protein [Streptomyces rhizosphaerihabitans]MCT9008917.1 hypothetical protein [Streptomyces rhizosphaerihabitans]